MNRLYKLHSCDDTAIKKEIATLAEMATPTPAPDQEFPSLLLLPQNIHCVRPSIILTGPENDYPTMDLKTLNEFTCGRKLQNFDILRIAPAGMVNRKQHPQGGKCKKCDRAAAASRKFAACMEIKVVTKGTKAGPTEEGLVEETTTNEAAVTSQDKEKYTGGTSKYGGSEGSQQVETWLEQVMGALAIAEEVPPRCERDECVTRNEAVAFLRAKFLKIENGDI
jgi:hypothetical protein